MKQTLKTIAFVICLLTMAFVVGANAQTSVKLDQAGNYVSASAGKDSVSYKATGKTFTDNKGKSYPVYVSKNGKLFVLRISKAGNEYRQYLKVN